MTHTANKPVPGRIYHVHHRRRGDFQMYVYALEGDFARGTVTAGEAGARLLHNERYAGETITVRMGLCCFTELTCPN